MIQELFHTLKTIDQIWIVVKSSFNRLSSTEKFCCDKISMLYGKDIKEIITGMVSHYDSAKSCADSAMKSANIEFK